MLSNTAVAALTHSNQSPIKLTDSFIGISIDRIMTWASHENIKTVRFAKWVLWQDWQPYKPMKVDLLMTIVKGQCVEVNVLSRYS